MQGCLFRGHCRGPRYLMKLCSDDVLTEFSDTISHWVFDTGLRWWNGWVFNLCALWFITAGSWWTSHACRWDIGLWGLMTDAVKRRSLVGAGPRSVDHSPWLFLVLSVSQSPCSPQLPLTILLWVSQLCTKTPTVSQNAFVLFNVVSLIQCVSVIVTKTNYS